MADRERYTGYGMPEMDFSPIARLPELYRNAQNERTLSDLGEGLASGKLDYRTAAGMAAKAGRPDFSLSLLKLGESASEREKTDAQRADFQRMFGRLVGGGDESAPPAPAQPVPSPATAPPAPAPVLRQRQTAAPGSPNERVASAFDATQGAIDTGVLDPQGENGQGIPTNAQAAQYVVPGPQGLAPQAQPQTGVPPAARMQPPIGAGPQPSPRSSPIQGNIPALVAMMSHPGADAGQRETAKVLLQEAIKQPDNLREYDFYQKQTRANGGQPLPVLDYFMQKAAAGTQGRAENTEQAAIGKGAGEAAVATMKAADSAPKTIANLNKMELLLSNVTSGKMAPTQMTVGAWAKAFGVSDDTLKGMGLDPNAVGNMQAITAFSNELAMGKIGAGGIPANNFSDADRNFITGTVANLANDPRANSLLIESARRMAKLDIEKANAYRDFRKQNPGASYYDFETRWINDVSQRDIFGDLAKKAQAIAPQSQSQGTTPSNPAAPPSSGARIIRNPNTGETLIEQGGKWVPFQ